jgi:hypothetical protein
MLLACGNGDDSNDSQINDADRRVYDDSISLKTLVDPSFGLFAESSRLSDFVLSSSWVSDNRSVARTYSDPDERLRQLDTWQRITGYSGEFTHASGNDEVSLSVSLYKDATGARAAIDNTSATLATEIRQLMDDAGVEVTRSEEFDGPEIGDASFRYRVHISAEAFGIVISRDNVLLYFQARNLIASVNWQSDESNVLTRDVEDVASDLLARIGTLDSFLVGTTASSLAPTPGEATTVVVSDTTSILPDEGRDHVAPGIPGGPYLTSPAASGPHWITNPSDIVPTGSPARWGAYATPLPDEVQIHNLEHGGVILNYNCPEGCAELVGQLQSLIPGQGAQFILAPYPNMDTRIAITAWQHQDKMDEFNADRLNAFINAYLDKAPESVSGNLF